MFKRIILSVLMLAGLMACTAKADTASIKKNLEAKFPKADISSVTKTPYAGLYEVVIDGQIVYSDDNANYLFLGSVVDTRTKKNITNERLAKLNTVNPDTFPLDHALKFVSGDGSRKLIIFSDPECPYCKRLEQDLAKVDNVTAYIFPYPIESLHPGTTAVSKAIWCAKDRNAAWKDALLKNVYPKNDGKCDNPIDANLALGDKLHITGTPTLFFANGQRVPGAVAADKLDQMLNAAK